MADAAAAAAGTTTDAAAAGAQPSADSLQLQQDGRKSKQPIKYVPPKPASGNPNFGPRKAWPGGSITVKYPKNAPPPGTHRWKDGGWKQQQQQPGHGSAQAHASNPHSSSRFRAAGGHGGGINMHSAVALQLQSAAGSRTTGSSGGGSAASRNGHAGGSGDDPEPGEVPVGLRRRLASHPGAPAAAGASAAARGSGLAQLYKQQQGAGSLLEAMAQRRGSGGSPRGGGPLGAGPSLRRPSGGSPAFAEGYGVADRLLAALERNALQLANSHAAVIAAHPPGEEANALRHGFQSRIRRQQQEYADNAAYVAELDEYLAAALGRGGSAPAAPAAVKDSLSFDVDSPGFGRSISVAPAEGAWAAGGQRRGVGVLRHGSRRVEVVGGAAGAGRQAPAGGAVSRGDDGMVGTSKGPKRRWPESDAGPSRKVVAIGGSGSGSGSGGNPKFVKSAAAKAQAHASMKQPAAAAQQAAASVQQKLGMSLDAIAGKPANPKPVQRPAAKAAAAGVSGRGGGGSAAGGAAAAGGSGKHTPIAWQA